MTAKLMVIDNIVVHYGRIAALRNLSLEVNAGEIVGLIGPNGAGKSTTLAAISGLCKPTVGSIMFDGQEISGRTPEWIVSNGIALVPEGRQIFTTLSVAENLQLGMLVRDNRKQAQSDLEAILQSFPILRTYYRQSAAALSGGEQQMLAIARALLCKPRLLLLDEPSLGLAPQMIDLVFQIIQELNAEGVTILLVEQAALRTVAVADRTYILGSGELKFAGTRAEIEASGDIARTYLGTA